MRAVDRGLRAVLTSQFFVAALVTFAIGFVITASWLSDAIFETTLTDDLANLPLPSIRLQSSHRCARDYRDNILEVSSEGYLCPEPIDAVYTWVNGSEEFQAALVKYWQKRAKRDDDDASATPAPATPFAQRHHNKTKAAAPTAAASGTSSPLDADAALSAEQLDEQSSVSRFQDHDELRYSLRSLDQFAPWVRRVYIVTNGQVPTWLNLDHPRIKVISHNQIFPDPSHLPTFSSPAIEAHLHRIPGLSKRFLYLNDDTFFGAPVVPDDFYSPTRGHRIFLSWPVPNCAQGCPSTWLKDGFCDRACNTSDCDWDGGDCLGDQQQQGKKAPSYPINGHGVKVGTPVPAPTDPSQCAPGCMDSLLGNERCDPPCDHVNCGFDGGDCDLSDLRRKLVTLNITRRRRLAFRLPADTRAFTVNVSEWFPPSLQANIASGEFDDACWVRVATIVQAQKLLVITVKDVMLEEEQTKRRVSEVCTFVLKGSATAPKLNDADGERTVQIELHFNVTIPIHRTLPNTLPFAHRKNTSAPKAASTQLPTPASAEPHATPTTTEEAHARSAHAPPSTPSVAQRNMELAKAQSYADESLTHGTQRRVLSIDEHEREFLLKMARQREIERQNDELRHAADWRKALKDAAGLPDGAAHAAVTQRRLLDMFGDSLKFGNKLLANRFGNSARKVPCHMVHLIDRDVVQRIWDIWPEEYAATSASKFRSKRNIQYGFFHFYYIMHAQREWTADSIFDELVDINQNGVIDDIEIRRMALVFFEKGLRDRTLQLTLVEAAQNASRLLGITRTEEQTLEGTPTDAPPSPPSTTQRSLLSSVMDPSEREPTHTAELSISSSNGVQARRSMPVLAQHGRNGSHHIAIDGKAAATPVQTSTEPVSPAPLTYAPFVAPNPDDRIEPLPESMVTLVRQLAEQGAFGLERRALRFAAEAAAAASTTDAPAATAEGESSSSSSNSGSEKTVDSAAQIAEPTAPRALTRELFRDTALSKLLMDKVQLGQFAYSLESESDVTFFMVRDNATVVQHQMDHVLYKRSKFLCINDNMNHSHPEHPKVLAILHKLFEAYYPHPSGFERTDGERNSFTRLSDDELGRFYGTHASTRWNQQQASARQNSMLMQPLGSIGFRSGPRQQVSIERAFALVVLTLLCLIPVASCVALRRRALATATRRTTG